MSAYPGAIDSFTTHVDNTEYMTAADLNNVQSSIVAIETILGVNPQGSYSTVLAWLQALNSAVGSGVSLDTASADIQPVGTAAAAGNAGKAADAKHVHVGVTSLNVNGGGATSGALVITIPQIDTTASDIQPLASRVSAGSSTKSAAADHAHTEGMAGVLTWMSI